VRAFGFFSTLLARQITLFLQLIFLLHSYVRKINLFSIHSSVSVSDDLRDPTLSS